MIKVTHLEDKGVYHFKLPHGSWKVNGKQITVEGYNGQEITSERVPEIMTIKSHHVLRDYKAEDGSTMSVERYTAEVKELRAKGYEDEDEDYGWGFFELDDEYAYKRFSRQWKPEYDLVITETVQELEILHAMYDTGSQYIRPLFCIDTSKPNLVHFFKAALQRDAFMEWCKEAGRTSEIPTHSHLRFAKVDGEYVFSGHHEKEVDGSHPLLTMTLEEARKAEKEVVGNIKRVLNSRFINASKLDTYTVGKVIDALMAARTTGSSGKYNSRASKGRLVDDINKDINKAINMLQEACQ